MKRSIVYSLAIVLALGLVVAIWQSARFLGLSVRTLDSTAGHPAQDNLPTPARHEWGLRLADAQFDIVRDREAAMLELRDIVENAPPSRDRVEAMHFLGTRLAEEKEYDESLHFLSQAVAATAPDSPIADSKLNAKITSHLALIEFHASRFEESLLHAQKARASQGMSEDNFHALSAMNLAMLSKWDEAYGHLEKLRDTDDPMCQTLLSLAHEYQGRQEMAEQARNRAEALNKSEAEIWRQRFESNSRPAVSGRVN